MGNWIVDFIMALVIGVSSSTVWCAGSNVERAQSDGLVQSFKSDVLSLTAWQIGMYA